jgi:hypothetical protein
VVPRIGVGLWSKRPRLPLSEHTVATRTHILFLALTLSVSAVSAQQNETKPAPTHGNTLGQQGPSPEAAAVAALEASPEMHSLSRFLGTWCITYVLDPTTAMPRGGTGEGQEVYRLGPGGHSLIEEFRARETEGDVTGSGTLWWEEGSHGYLTTWNGPVGTEHAAVARLGSKHRTRAAQS